MPNNVSFYSLANMPNTFRNGSFLELTSTDNNNPAGLYFCFNGSWKYLMGIKSAAVYNGVIYFYNTSPAPTLNATPPAGSYVFSLTVPNPTLANYTVQDGTTTPHSGSSNLLKIDGDGKFTINDTWDCGTYDNAVYRHLSHLKTTSVKYESILKKDIPDNATVLVVQSVPANPTSSSDPYIQLSGNNHYYKLVPVKPLNTSLDTGEIAVSYSAGYERLYIKNTSNQIVEFEPARSNKNVVCNATFQNPVLTVSNNNCVWNIPYSDINAAGISKYGAVVFLRENSTGKQLIPDVLFDDVNSRITITLYSTENISLRTYTAIVIGSYYNDTTLAQI